MKRKRIYLLIVLLCIMAVTTTVYYLNETKSMDILAAYMTDDWISFSEEDGFYTESIRVKLKLNSAFPFTAKIYYTTDGSEPTEVSSVYKKPIVLEAGEETKIATIRAVVAYKGELSEVFTKTYVLGTSSPIRYTTPVVSIAANPEDLYSDEQGILVPGQLFKDYVQETGYEGQPGFKQPANFNAGWIRPVNVTIFTPAGNRLINQKAGMYVGGNSSREMEQKTLMLDADEQYDEEHPRFEYLFETRNESSDLSLLTSYGKLKLRNFSGDYTKAYLRGQLCAEIAYAAGMSSTLNIEPAVVYLNNEYYGMAELQPTYSPNYLGNLYGIEDKAAIEVYTGDESGLLDLLGYPGNVAIDLNDPTVREDLESKLDMDDLLRYYTIEIIINNIDWPLNNVKAWRYTGTPDASNPYTDGKFRFLLFDTDAAFNLHPEDDDLFDLLLYNDNPGELWNFFYEMMQYEPYKQKFVNQLLDLTATACSTESMLEKVVEVNQKMAVELTNYKEETPFESVRTTLAQRDEAVAFLLNTIYSRNDEITEFLRRYFDTYEKAYTLEVKPPQTDCRISVNTVDVYKAEESFLSTRYRNYPVTLRADVSAGNVFKGWRVNDTVIEDEELLIIESMVTSDYVTVELITEPISGTTPIIDRVSAKGADDWIELYNPYENVIQLSDFCLSNRQENLQKYNCPQVELGSHETIRIYGKKSSVLNSYLANFSLKAGETLYLYDKREGTSVESLLVPEMNETESYGRSFHTNKYQFFEAEQ